MTSSRWENLMFRIEEKFSIDKQYAEDFEVAETSSGEKIMGQRQAVEFVGPMGRIKLEKTARPRVIDKKILRTKRIGGKVAVNFVYSNEDKVEEIKIYKQSLYGKWEEMNTANMGFT